MKRTLGILLMLSISLFANAQKKITVQDSVKTFYDALFSALKKKYLYAKAVDWHVAEAGTRQNLVQYDNFASSLSEIKPLFDKIGATHCNVYYKQNKYAATGKKITNTAYSKQWANKMATKPDFEVKVLNEKYGYILMPNMVFFDLSAKNMHEKAQTLYDQIYAIKARHKLEGWIVDLRFNSGGNEAPMILALYDFLGDNLLWGSLDVNKKQYGQSKLEKGKYLYNGKTVSHINPNGDLLDKMKVAVITGIATASSGEITALAFKGRANTVFIGESTYGATTGNVPAPLPFDSIIALTTSYDCDRNGNYYERIVPDITVSKGDNFDDVNLDKNILEAIKFISKKC